MKIGKKLSSSSWKLLIWANCPRICPNSVSIVPSLPKICQKKRFPIPSNLIHISANLHLFFAEKFHEFLYVPRYPRHQKLDKHEATNLTDYHNRANTTPTNSNTHLCWLFFLLILLFLLFFLNDRTPNINHGSFNIRAYLYGVCVCPLTKKE